MNAVDYRVLWPIESRESLETSKRQNDSLLSQAGVKLKPLGVPGSFYHLYEPLTIRLILLLRKIIFDFNLHPNSSHDMI